MARGRQRRPARTGAATVTMSADTSGLDALLAELNSTVAGAVRPAAQSGAQVFYEEVQRNVARLGKVKGNLARAIYQAFSKDNSQDGVSATYHVSWNYKKAPHGRLVEYGYIAKFQRVITKSGKWITLKSKPIAPKHIAAHPFIRPAFSQAPQAVAAAEAEIAKRVNEMKNV